MNETMYIITTNPAMPLAGQISTCWGPIPESKLADFIAGFHIPNNYLVYELGAAKKEFMILGQPKTEVKDL